MPFTMIHGGDMNERMKELAKQAGFGPTANPYERQAFDVNMFAELIVRECANVVDEHEPLNTWTKRYSTLIKEHFGVEE